MFGFSLFCLFFNLYCVGAHALLTKSKTKTANNIMLLEQYYIIQLSLHKMLHAISLFELIKRFCWSPHEWTIEHQHHVQIWNTQIHKDKYPIKTIFKTTSTVIEFWCSLLQIMITNIQCLLGSAINQECCLQGGFEHQQLGSHHVTKYKTYNI